MGRIKEVLNDMALLVRKDFNLVKGDVIKVVIENPRGKRPGTTVPKKGVSAKFRVVNSTDNSARIVSME